MEASEAIEYHRGYLGGHMFHLDTVVMSVVVIGAYIVVSLSMRKKLKILPGRAQSVMEMIINYFQDLCCSMAGEKGKEYTPYIMSIFLFVVGCNWLGLLPHFFKLGPIPISMPPTRDLNTTLALAIVSFFAFQYFGYKEKGVKYLLHYIYPIPLLWRSLPWTMRILLVPPLFMLFLLLNIMEELARVLSLSFRLMGNILGEHLVAASLILFVGVVSMMGIVGAIFSVVVDVFPLFMLFLGLVVGAIQAFIFSVLTLSYISHAVEDEH